MERLIRFEGETRRHFIEIGRYYRSINYPLYSRFVHKFDKKLKTICDFPKTGSKAFKAIRYFRIHGFPYYVFYKFTASTIQIVLISHTSSDPRERRKKLRQL